MKKGYNAPIYTFYSPQNLIQDSRTYRLNSLVNRGLRGETMVFPRGAHPCTYCAFAYHRSIDDMVPMCLYMVRSWGETNGS